MFERSAGLLLASDQIGLVGGYQHKPINVMRILLGPAKTVVDHLLMTTVRRISGQAEHQGERLGGSHQC